jgi:hypothetical protein
MPSTAIHICNLLLIAISTTCTTTTSTNWTRTHTVTATSYISFNGTFSCFQYIGFSHRMIGEYWRQKDLQLHSHGLVQYTVLAILAETAHNHETNSSQHGPFRGQPLVQTPTFSNEQTSNWGIKGDVNYNTKTYWTIMNTNFHIVNKVCLLFWQKYDKCTTLNHSRPGSETCNAHFIINLSFPNTHKMHLAIIKHYPVNVSQRQMS